MTIKRGPGTAVDDADEGKLFDLRVTAERREKLLADMRLLLLARDDRTAGRIEQQLVAIRTRYRSLLAGRGTARRKR